MTLTPEILPIASTVFVTTVSRSYLPLARVLMRSVAQHHLESKRYILLLDDGPDATEHAEILRPQDLIADGRELRVQQGMYSALEFATALKAKALMHLLSSAEQAFFLDPDMRLLAPMRSAQAALRDGSGTLMTPHLLTPPSHEDRALFEGAVKIYGTWNTGFFGATQASLPLLRWWDRRLSRDCIDALSRGEWVDQRMMDLAPGYFDVDIFRDPAYNVGWWNLYERPLRREGQTWYAGEAPLVLMHYSGVRPDRPRTQFPQLVHSPANPVTRDLDHLAVIQSMEDEYVVDLMAEEFEKYGRSGYDFSTAPHGRPWSVGDRRGYRELVLAAESRGEAPPLPEDVAWTRFARWMRAAPVDLPRSVAPALRRARSLTSRFAG